MARPGYLGLLIFCWGSRQRGAHGDSSGEYQDCRGNTTLIHDGVCHSQNNNEACSYDGGDCCSCTCVDGPEYSCGQRGLGFFCIDPSAPCVDATAAPTPVPTPGVSYPDCDGSTSFIGDGDCDDNNNNPGCIYDGGDCCPCTCVPSENFFCEDFDCVDPEAPCASDIPTAAPTTASPTVSPTPEFVPGYPNCTESAEDVGDGFCDSSANIKDCGYDGGDCCECTCVPTAAWSCGQDDDFTDFNCRDPDSGCRPTPSPTLPDFPDCQGFTPHINDGYCDAYNNNADCGYDGGDCCECTCLPGPRYSCGQDDDFDAFDCQDPSAACSAAVQDVGGTRRIYEESTSSREAGLPDVVSFSIIGVSLAVLAGAALCFFIMYLRLKASDPPLASL